MGTKTKEQALFDTARAVRRAERTRAALMLEAVEKYEEGTEDAPTCMKFLMDARDCEDRFMRSLVEATTMLIDAAIPGNLRAMMKEMERIVRDEPERLEGLDGLAMDEGTGEIRGLKDGELMPLEEAGLGDLAAALNDLTLLDTTPLGEATIEGINLDATFEPTRDFDGNTE